MKIRTYIVEDSPRSQKTIIHLLETYCPQVEVLGAANSTLSAVEGIRKLRPHLVLLDVKLSPGDGFEVLQQLTPLDFEVIFTTAYDNHALKAFKFNALDYLLKPINIRELIEAVNKAETRLHQQADQRRYERLLETLEEAKSRLPQVPVPTMEGLEFIQVDEIIRLEGDEGYTQIYLNLQATLTTTRRLKEWEHELKGYNFFRIHRSHLINLNYLKRYHRGQGGYVEMTDGTVIDVPRRRKEEFMRRLSGGNLDQ
ncbi:MAG: LytTR family DNA-binding domain-containing protein [Bacteroidota bacterium]